MNFLVEANNSPAEALSEAWMVQSPGGHFLSFNSKGGLNGTEDKEKYLAELFSVLYEF